MFISHKDADVVIMQKRLVYNEQILQKYLSISLYNLIYHYEHMTSCPIVLTFFRIKTLKPDYFILNVNHKINCLINRIAIFETKYISTEDDRAFREKIFKTFGQLARYRSVFGLPVYLVINEAAYEKLLYYYDLNDLDPYIGIISLGAVMNQDKKTIRIQLNIRKYASEVMSTKIFYSYLEIIPIVILYNLCRSLYFLSNEDKLKLILKFINSKIKAIKKDNIIQNYNIFVNNTKIQNYENRLCIVEGCSQNRSFGSPPIYGIINLMELMKMGIIGGNELHGLHGSFIISTNLLKNMEFDISNLILNKKEFILNLIDFAIEKIKTIKMLRNGLGYSELLSNFMSFMISRDLIINDNNRLDIVVNKFISCLMLFRELINKLS